MICQRLSQEYQLVDTDERGEEMEEYKHYIMSNGRGRTVFRAQASSLPPSLPPSLPATTTGTTTLSPPTTTTQKDHFYILTMGHRIQFISYDEGTKQVRVTRLLWSDPSKKNSKNSETESKAWTYSYLNYVSQRRCFQAMSQTFHQFPPTEYAWNTADEILLGKTVWGGGSCVYFSCMCLYFIHYTFNLVYKNS